MGPRILAPVGSSDHNIVQWLPSLGNVTRAKPIKRLVRRYPRSGRLVTAHDWHSELGSTPTADDFAAAFTSQLILAVDLTFPLKTLKCNHSDKPWITPAIKLLIKDRQKAFHNLNLPLWRSLRHKVQQEIAERKKAYYKNKVQDLRKDDCRSWWGTVNRLTGRSEKATSYSLECDGKVLNEMELADTLNRFYVSVNEDIPPLDATTIQAFLLAETCVPTIQPQELCRKLLAVQPFKAQGPDNVPCRILKEFAYELAEPVTTIFSATLASGIVPAIWKDSNVTPIPKIQSPTYEGDFRPISLTPCLSKILEDFVVTWMIDDIRNGISSNLCMLVCDGSNFFHDEVAVVSSQVVKDNRHLFSYLEVWLADPLNLPVM
ncbi:uncharacterized protein [Montipora foliosa]|uniref:uncharacterized protein n=1 Tax=Montipora foliosa TaxID=591990 RepID=UPI0035F1062A